jgi:aromatic amino acid aminotransferase I
VSKSYLGWLKALKQDFSYRRNVAIEYCSKYLPECANVKAPIAGMFFATGFDCTKHSEFIAKFESDPLILEAAIFKKPLSTDAQVLV